MNKKYSLKANYAIEKIVKSKKSVGNIYYAIYYNWSLNQTAKIAISVSKKIGNAVVRNHQKRIIREILRNNTDQLFGLELLIVQKKQAIGLSFLEKKDTILSLLAKIYRKEEKKKNE